MALAFLFRWEPAISPIGYGVSIFAAHAGWAWTQRAIRRRQEP
jgi:hypothetical protein